MEFNLHEEQEMFRQVIKSFARKELAVGIKERAQTGLIPQNIITKMADIGLLGVNVPEIFGGQPADWVMTGILAEELGKVDSLAAHIAGLSTVTAMALLQANESIQQEWIPQLVNGGTVACLAMTEPDAGSDVSAIKTRAVRQGDSYILSGEKAPVTGGRQAGIAIVDAKADTSDGGRGISCFLVPLELPGVSRQNMSYMGNAEGLASIILDSVRIPSEFIIGEEGRGLRIVIGQLDITRVWAGLIALAMAQISLEETVNYVKQRTVFGRLIAKFEGISFKLAEGFTKLEASRLLCYQALWLKDQNRSFVKEAAMAKLMATEVAVSIIHDTLLIHGHYGFSTEYPIEQRLRDAIGEELASGTHEMMKLTICQYILGREFLSI